MGFYNDRILPRLVHMTMRQPALVPYRQRTIAAAEGRVLELGVGSGLNLPFYGERADQIIGLDPSTGLLALAREHLPHKRGEPQLVLGSAEGIPLEDGSVDTIVTTWTLCSIPDVTRALAEARRILKPSGRLVFVEHGLSPDPRVRQWQHRLTPLWKRLAGGCHLNRPIDRLIEAAGFRVEHLDTRRV